MHDILDCKTLAYAAQWDALSLASQTLPRSPSSSKIQKKQNKPARPQDDFDSLLDSLLNKPKNSLNSAHRLHLDSKQPYESKTSQPPPRTSFGSNASQAQIEDNGLVHHFGNTQKSIFNPSRSNESSFVSTRNMKPPLRPKENSHTQSIFASGTVIPEEDPALTNSSHQRSTKRRSSIDANSELDEVPPLPYGTIQSVQFDTIKEDAFPNIHKSQSCLLTELKHDSQTPSFFRARDKLQCKSQSLKIPAQLQKKSTQNGSESASQGSFQQQLKKIAEHYEGQLQLLKKSYQGQLQHLEQCLSKQINENRSLRATFLEESNKLLQQQRERTHRINEEELQRTKDLLLWQQKKQEDSFNMQIESLKKTLEMMTSQQDSKGTRHCGGASLEFQKLQLQSKEERIATKMRELEQRSLQVQSREAQLQIRVRREEDRLREEEKRLAQMQLEFRTRMMEEKKGLAQEKQNLAIEMTTLQSEYLKKKDQLFLKQKQLQLQMSSLEQEKQAMATLNSQSYQQHKLDLDDLHRQRQKTKQLQIQLIQKIRVVQLKARQLSCNQQDWPSFKKNNWIDRNYRAESAEKKLNNSQSMTQMNKTKERFSVLERNSKSRMQLKENKKIDLSGYITKMESHITRHS